MTKHRKTQVREKAEAYKQNFVSKAKELEKVLKGTSEAINLLHQVETDIQEVLEYTKNLATESHTVSKNIRNDILSEAQNFLDQYDQMYQRINLLLEYYNENNQYSISQLKRTCNAAISFKQNLIKKKDFILTTRLEKREEAKERAQVLEHFGIVKKETTEQTLLGESSKFSEIKEVADVYERIQYNVHLIDKKEIMMDIDFYDKNNLDDIVNKLKLEMARNPKDNFVDIAGEPEKMKELFLHLIALNK